MSNTDFAHTLQGIESLLACFVVDASSGALHRQFQRSAASVDAEAVARAVAGLARAQTDIVGSAHPATVCTLEWPETTIIVRTASSAALVVFFFRSEITLGAARLHVERIIHGLAGQLPDLHRKTARAMPSLGALRTEGSPQGVDPAQAEAVLEDLSTAVSDVRAALLRVSLQTGVSMEVLEAPRTWSIETFERVAASVRRILERRGT